MYAYSLIDRAIAKDIIRNRNKRVIVAIENDTPIFGEFIISRPFVSWALKVLRWFNRFYQVLRHYAKFEGNDIIIATVAIWDNLKAGISLVNMLRELSKYELSSLADIGILWQSKKANFADTVLLINPKVSKQYLRAKCRRIADTLQSRSI